MLRTVDPFTFSFFKQLTSWPMVHTVGNVYLCTASKWISFIAWISAQRKPHLWFDNSFWLTLWVQVSSHMEMGLKTRPDSPKKWCQVSDCRLRAWRSHTYHSLCLGGSGAPLGPLHANSMKWTMSSKPRVSLTADRCRPHYWLLLIEFLGFAELKHGSPSKDGPREKRLSLDPTPSDPKHSGLFPAAVECKRDQQIKKSTKKTKKTKLNILFWG